MRIVREIVAVVGLLWLALPGWSAQLTIPGSAPDARQVSSLDSDWRFLLGDAKGAEQPNFDDSKWTPVTVPHDWSVEGTFDAHAPTAGAGGFLPSGIGWYRRTISVPANLADHRVFVEFDGVMANSDVWINGTHLGHRPNGYVSLRYDLTPSLRTENGAHNVLAVRVDNSAQPASRWYAGAGINRHVRLIVSSPVHVVADSVFVTTPTIGDKQATIKVQFAVANDTGVMHRERVRVTIVAPDGKVAAQTMAPEAAIEPGKSVEGVANLDVENPVRWDLDRPWCYSAILEVMNSAGDQTTDNVTIGFGIRDAHFEAATGFWLNGRNIKLKGVCLHGDVGALGVAIPSVIWRNRLSALKALGCNAIRTAHCPPDPQFLGLCDQMGFLVMDEMFDVWTVAKEPYDYHLFFQQWSAMDCRDAVRRDRNHPCVILYSAGNEIRDTPNAASAHATLAALVKIFHDNDPTRPVTQALFRPNSSGDYENGLADLLDVVGQNYRENELIATHDAKPTRKIVGTENGHDRRAWLQVRDTPAFSGEFLWTGFDYLGESKAWPTVGSSSGLFDRTGEPRPIAWERASWWSDTPVVHIARRITASRATPSDPGFTPLAQRITASADWTPAIRSPHPETVEVYSNAANVELLLNGKSLGVKALPKDALTRTWIVSFEPGTLIAVARDTSDNEVGRDELRTAGPPAAIRLTSDEKMLVPNWGNVTCVHATIVDAEGIPIPDAANLVEFGLSGPGSIVAVDSGDNSSHEPFRAKTRTAYRGRCVAYIRMTGPNDPLTIMASSQGLKMGTVVVRNGSVF